ncbi:RNA polymerase sigma-70 factor [Cytobacillus suaedae]|nr:RNA polymerase sigma-70 factor [Cytobacillus suaedae]
MDEQFYMEYKPLLFSIAYRLLGEVTMAEDIVHDIFVDSQSVDFGNVSNPKAYLCKMVTNRTIDFLKSAKKKREVYSGPWLPEPLVSYDNNPLETVIRHDRVSYALQMMLEQLGLFERAVYVLRVVFDYDYSEISTILGKSEATCRKILSRAKSKVSHLDFRMEDGYQPKQVNHLINEFIYASSTGNLQGLLTLLCDHSVLYSDGGGKVKAALLPIYTSQHVAMFILGITKKAVSESFEVKFQNINGQTGIVILKGSEPESVITFHIEQEKIKNIYIIRNPDKLKHLTK